MANMSYCRFQNTSQDIQDCIDNIDAELSAAEHAARKRLVRQSARLLTSLGIDITEADLKEALEEVDGFQ